MLTFARADLEYLNCNFLVYSTNRRVILSDNVDFFKNVFLRKARM